MYLSTIFSLISFFLTAAFWATPAVAGPAGLSQNDPSIMEGSDAYLKAVLAGDLPAITGLFQDDATLMPPNQPSLRGRTAIDHFYRGMCGGPVKPTAFTFDHLEANAAGDVGYDVGTYKQTLVVGPGKTIEDTGNYSAILKRTGGEWKIAYLIFNSSLAQPPLGNVKK